MICISSNLIHLLYIPVQILYFQTRMKGVLYNGLINKYDLMRLAAAGKDEHDRRLWCLWFKVYNVPS